MIVDLLDDVNRRPADTDAHSKTIEECVRSAQRSISAKRQQRAKVILRVVSYAGECHLDQGSIISLEVCAQVEIERTIRLIVADRRRREHLAAKAVAPWNEPPMTGRSTSRLASSQFPRSQRLRDAESSRDAIHVIQRHSKNTLVSPYRLDLLHDRSPLATATRRFRSASVGSSLEPRSGPRVVMRGIDSSFVQAPP